MKKVFKMKRGARDLIARSTKATCGITEREVNVAKQNVSRAVKRLKNAGFHVIGTSYANTPMKKIWFIRRGGL